MTAFWAIVRDTWLQSRQQVVFLLMLGVLLLVAIGGTFLIKTVEVGGERRVALAGTDEPMELMEEMWTMTYASTLLSKDDALDDLAGLTELDEAEQAEALNRRLEAVAETARAEDRTSRLQRGAEMWMASLASTIFFVSMLAFLGASAGYFPAMLESGAVDIVLSKPIDRLRIYLGKYVGGLILFALAITATYLLLFAGLGLRLGVWMPRIFLLLPLQIFSAAVLYAMLAAVGVYSRSSTFCLVVGLIFYIVVDTGLNALFQVQEAMALTGMGGGVFGRSVEVARYMLPNFGQLKQAAATSVLNMPIMDWRPVVVGGIWGLIFLAVGYQKFHRSDY